MYLNKPIVYGIECIRIVFLNADAVNAVTVSFLANTNKTFLANSKSERLFLRKNQHMESQAWFTDVLRFACLTFPSLFAIVVWFICHKFVVSGDHLV